MIECPSAVAMRQLSKINDCRASLNKSLEMTTLRIHQHEALNFLIDFAKEHDPCINSFAPTFHYRESISVQPPHHSHARTVVPHPVDIQNSKHLRQMNANRKLDPFSFHQPLILRQNPLLTLIMLFFVSFTTFFRDYK